MGKLVIGFLGYFMLLQPLGAEEPSFNRDVLPVFQKHCAVCHSEPLKAGGLLLGNYAELMKGGAGGPVIAPGNPEESLLVAMLDGRKQPMMPQGGPPLDERTLGILRDWIKAGAKGPAAGEAEPAAAAVAIPDIKPRAAVTSPVASLAFHPNGRVLAVGRYQKVELIESDGGRAVAELGGHADAVRALAFSRDGRWLAAAGGRPGERGEIRVWDVETRTLARTIEGHTDCVYAVAFSADGKSVASASYDKLVKIWDTATGQEQKTLKDHVEAVFAMQFSPDGRRLATAAADRTVKVWDPVSGRRFYTLSDAEDALYTLAWHPSGKQIAAGGADKTLRVWDVWDGETPGGKQAASITGHEDAIVQVAYSPDGETLVTAGADRQIKLWDPATLAERRLLEPQPDWVMALAFSPDGSQLVAGRYDGSLSFYRSDK